MTQSKPYLYGAIVLAIIGMMVAMSYQSFSAKASAPSGLPATIATSTPNLSVNTTQKVIIATSTACATRIVSSKGSALMLTFTDAQGTVPSATKGFVQAASTTVAYDSGQYGCGAVRVYSFTTTLIGVAEAR